MRGALHDLYRRYELQRHGQLVKDLNHDPKAIVQLYQAQALWVQGYPDQAVRRCEEERPCRATSAIPSISALA